MKVEWQAITAMCAVLALTGTLMAVYVKWMIRGEIDTLLTRLNGAYVRTPLCEAYRVAEAANLVAASATHSAAAVAAEAARSAHVLVEEATNTVRRLHNDYDHRIAKIEENLARTED